MRFYRTENYNFTAKNFKVLVLSAETALWRRCCNFGEQFHMDIRTKVGKKFEGISSAVYGQYQLLANWVSNSVKMMNCFSKIIFQVCPTLNGTAKLYKSFELTGEAYTPAIEYVVLSSIFILFNVTF